MNHIAHCFLSGEEEAVLIGNFMGDYVKGSRLEGFSPGIRRGLMLHRMIDSFTDNHERVRACVARLRPWAGRYAGPVCDVLFDRVLVLDWDVYSPDEAFSVFSQRVYAVLEAGKHHFPEPLASRWPHMRAADFLEEYCERAGMERVMARMSRRIPLAGEGKPLLEAFDGMLEDFQRDFAVFFPDMVSAVQADKSA